MMHIVTALEASFHRLRSASFDTSATATYLRTSISRYRSARCRLSLMRTRSIMERARRLHLNRTPMWLRLRAHQQYRLSAETNGACGEL